MLIALKQIMVMGKVAEKTRNIPRFSIPIDISTYIMYHLSNCLGFPATTGRGKDVEGVQISYITDRDEHSDWLKDIQITYDGDGGVVGSVFMRPKKQPSKLLTYPGHIYYGGTKSLDTFTFWYVRDTLCTMYDGWHGRYFRKWAYETWRSMRKDGYLPDTLR